ncbi:MAG: 50S ribosomal protein L11 methyltransferase [Bacteroidota bacterium]
MDYYRFEISADSEKSQLILAFLSALPFDAFEEMEAGMIAYIPSSLLTPEIELEVKSIIDQFDGSYSKSFLESKNWNKIWESEFEPVEIGDFCRIRASFHKPSSDFQFEIIIDPKMAFGTGHHATTTLMIELMSTLSFQTKKVLDFGAGTGILAILASKMGATSLLANEIEEQAFENIKQNLELNVIQNVKPILGSLEVMNDNEFDIILANINRNTLLKYIPALYHMVKSNGLILLSGFYEKDEFRIIEKAKDSGFVTNRRQVLNNWVCLEILKP